MENIQWLSDRAILEKTGGKAREWRLEQNLSQKELAERAGISLITVQQFESGRNVSLTTMLRILRILRHLDIFAPFLEETEVSPLEYQKLLDGQKKRKRASKTKKDDTDTDSEPLW